MTTPDEVGDKIDSLTRFLEAIGEMTPEVRRKLDACRTDPGKMGEAVDAAYARFAIGMNRIANDVEQMTKCLAIYVTAAAKVKEETQIDIGIPYDIARAAMRLTEAERNRMARQR